MKKHLSARLVALGIALGAATIVVVAAQAGTASRSREHATGAVVALRKTALGSILVDSRGRTLYLFEKDRNGVSMCNTACVAYWPALTSRGTPRAGKGVQQSLLRLGRAQNGVRQVTYAGHPLYTFVGDKQAGQTTGEGLNNFGAEWYALAASGRTVKASQPSGSGSGSGYGSGYGYASSW
jgi:predicted lipoprotein with Yx(FWY)xxD motif